MMRTRVVLLAAFVFAAGHVFAQTAARARPGTRGTGRAAPAQARPRRRAAGPPAPPAPPAARQPINVKVDLNITEDGGGGPPIKKSVSTVAGDGFNGSVRELATLGNATAPVNQFPLNLDAFPTILPNGKIRLQCNIQYQSAQSREPGSRSSTDIKQNFALILESGKPLVVTQATDPVSDRKVTVEVTATILR